MGRFLERKGKFLKFLLLAALLCVSSCTSVATNTRLLKQDEMIYADVIGTVETKFSSYQLFHTTNTSAIGDRAYTLLKKEANKKYPGGGIDVVNIQLSGKVNASNYVALFLFWPVAVFGNSQTITAIGDVISGNVADIRKKVQSSARYAEERTPRPSPPPQMASPPPQVASAPRASASDRVPREVIEKVTSEVLRGVPRDTKVAIVDMNADNWKVADDIIDDIEYNVVNSRRYTIVDRQRQDVIRKEQKFQTSGAVNDETAVKLGGIYGAKVVIIGSLTKSDGINRLSLRALDVETGEVIGRGREEY